MIPSISTDSQTLHTFTEPTAPCLESITIISSNCPSPKNSTNFQDFIHQPLPNSEQTIFIGQEITNITRLFNKNFDNLYCSNDFAAPKRFLTLFSPNSTVNLSSLKSHSSSVDQVQIDGKGPFDYYLSFPSVYQTSTTMRPESTRSKSIAVSAKFSLGQFRFSTIAISSHLGFYKKSPHSEEILFSYLLHLLYTDLDFVFLGIDTNMEIPLFTKKLDSFIQQHSKLKVTPTYTSVHLPITSEEESEFSNVDCLLVFQVSPNSHKINIHPLFPPLIPAFQNEDTKLGKNTHPPLGVHLTLLTHQE